MRVMQLLVFLKLRKTLAIIFLMLTLTVFSIEIPVSVARSVAQRHAAIFDQDFNANQELFIEPETGQPIGYLFQLDKGFIIVANDDEMPPVLGYSFEHPFDNSDILPTRIVAQLFQSALVNLDKADIDWKADNRSLWLRYLGSAPVFMSPMTVYGPLIASHWHQNAPYNNYCPWDSDAGARSVVGCTATSMGMLFTYYQWPPSVDFTEGESYWSTGTSTPIWIDAPTAAISYINYGGGSPTDDMCAQISKAAGVSVEMDYAYSGSSSNVTPPVFMGKWLYAYCREIDSDEGTFYTDMANSIINNDPAPMSICYVTGGVRYNGHRLLTDGYNDGTGAFHVNFGWGGMDDGWYNLPTGLPGTYNTVDDAIIDFAVPTFTRREVPGSYPNIQAALDAAMGGDTVVVMPGTYSGTGNKNLEFNGKWVYLKTYGGIHSVTIDLGSSGRFIHFQNGETSGAVVDGFRIINGSADQGAGIFVENFSCPTIRNCYFESNNATQFGGGLSITNTSSNWPIVENCVFYNNQATWNGGGLNVSFGKAILINNTIRGNYSNNGGGFHTCDISDVIMYNCIVWGNTAGTAGPDMYFSNYGYDPCTLYVAYTDYNPSNCSMAGGAGSIITGSGNINSNPDFIENCRTSGSSDCVDAGSGMLYATPYDMDLNAPSTDILYFPRPQGSGWDMGAYDYTVAADIQENVTVPDQFSVSAYPNPFNSTLHVAAPTNATVEIFDIHGNLVSDLGLGRTWDTNAPSGVYHLKITDGKYTKMIKASLVR